MRGVAVASRADRGRDGSTWRGPPLLFFHCPTAPAPLRPAMVFVNMDVKDQALGAAFQQNSGQRSILRIGPRQRRGASS